MISNTVSMWINIAGMVLSALAGATTQLHGHLRLRARPEGRRRDLASGTCRDHGQHGIARPVAGLPWAADSYSACRVIVRLLLAVIAVGIMLIVVQCIQGTP